MSSQLVTLPVVVRIRDLVEVLRRLGTDGRCCVVTCGWQGVLYRERGVHGVGCGG